MVQQYLHIVNLIEKDKCSILTAHLSSSYSYYISGMGNSLNQRWSTLLPDHDTFNLVVSNHSFSTLLVFVECVLKFKPSWRSVLSTEMPSYYWIIGWLDCMIIIWINNSKYFPLNKNSYKKVCNFLKSLLSLVWWKYIHIFRLVGKRNCWLFFVHLQFLSIPLAYKK